ncbi:uncharacterized protein [Prorops nasuta]|uniref:uncharacterized protein n=1 Tax=Prorops nasuta TaxID=863751 RepID=UPI0034CD55FD
MSFTVTLSDRKSVLNSDFFPPINLQDDWYEIGLVDMQTYNSIANVDETNNNTLKNLVSLSTEESASLRHSGWFVATAKDRLKKEAAVKNFSFCVPLKMLLGFYEDYRRVVVNARHEFVLIRARDDTNANYSSYPLLPKSQRHTWSVKVSTLLEKPRYVILAFRTNKKSNQHEDVLKFNHCKVLDVKLYLNFESYPYDRLDTDFTKSRYSVLYDMYEMRRGEQINKYKQ